jgi:hypothetical protein
VSYKIKASAVETGSYASPKTYRCVANNCPMPGSISGIGEGGGVCAWHYGANASDWPRITQKLLDWGCVTFEVNECRRIHTESESAYNARAIADAFAAACQRLQPQAGAWWDDTLKPGLLKSGFPESYRDWGNRLERFVGGQVQEQQNRRRIVA